MKKIHLKVQTIAPKVHQEGSQWQAKRSLWTKVNNDSRPEWAQEVAHLQCANVRMYLVPDVSRLATFSLPLTRHKRVFKLLANTSLSICVFLFLFCLSITTAQTLAPGAPGRDAQWQSAGKQGVGTSNTLESKVWFTLAEGVMTEVYYPDVTIANVQELQFIVVNPKTKKVETERDDATHQVKVLRNDSLTFQQINTAKSGEWKITKTYTTDPERDTVLIDVQFQTKNNELNLYVYYDPSIGNSGMHDFGSRKFSTSGDKEGKLVVEDSKSEIVSVLQFSSELSEQTVGFYQVSDGLEQLKQYGKIVNQYEQATNGNVVQMARIVSPSKFTTVLSFADKGSWIKAYLNASETLKKGFTKCLSEYEKGWSDYVKTLRKVDAKYQAQFNMAAMILRAHEDKLHRGANIASLSVPWGGGSNANENNVGGYHLVWSRDLYQVATAYMALGDKAAAERALDFLFKIQQKADGSFPQNSWLDGKPFWNSLQLDEVAFPLILAYQLGKNDKAAYENHVKRSADFIVKNGPVTPQERWEEEAGYSPSTIAAEIAGLVCAADIARKNGDETNAALYLKTADDWAANIEKWTATTTGKYGDGNYYLRITQNGKPDAGEKIELNNGAGFFDEREIVDAGFLELVRLGIKPADDPLIQKSLNVIDKVIKVNTPNGEAFYRYNNDGYGEMDDGRNWNFDGKYTGKGRLWALLSGERGQYELALQNLWELKTNGSFSKSSKPKTFQENLLQKELERQGQVFPKTPFELAQTHLGSMLGFANEGLMIPEQIWDKQQSPKPQLKFGEGTGSATPLAWSMAQFIRLAVNLQEGKNLDTPDIVFNRYAKNALTKKKEQTDAKIKEFDESCFGQWLFKTPTKPMDEVLGSEQKPLILQCKSQTNVDVVFLYKGKANNVEIVGDFTGWKPSGLTLKNNFNDYKYIVLTLPPTTRIEYKFVADGEWILDPFNKKKIDNGVGSENSFLTLPDYKPTEWDKETQIIGKLETLEIDSKVYGKRNVQVYVPKVNTLTDVRVSALYLQDGSDYIKRAKAIQIQENLVRAGKLKPFIMVFIDYKDRMKEYWASDDYAKFLATEVVPAIDAKYNTIKSREGRAVMGASLGGVTSVWAALKYPETFSRVAGQSSAWWIDNERVVKSLEQFKEKFTFYFDTGTLEGAEDDRKAVEILRRMGYDVVYQEGETGHNWTSWRDRLADAFLAVWK